MDAGVILLQLLQNESLTISQLADGVARFPELCSSDGQISSAIPELLTGLSRSGLIESVIA